MAILLGVLVDERTGRTQGDPLERPRAADNFKVLVVDLAGPITPELVEKTRGDAERHLEGDLLFDHVVFRLDASEGDIDAALELSRWIREDLSSRITIAFVPPGGAAMGPGAVVALSTKRLVMAADARIGAGSDEPPPVAEAQLQAILDAARFNGRTAELARAMFVPADDDLLRLDVNDGRPLYRTRRDWDLEDAHERVEIKGRMDNRDPVVVLTPGKLLTLTGEDAVKDYALADELAPSLEELFLVLRINPADENVVHAEESGMRADFPTGQRVVDFFYHPFVRFLLIVGGLLGVLLEIKLLGTMIPGTVGLVCFAVFFVSSYFPPTGHTVGTASPWEIGGFLVGLALIATELLAPGTLVFALTGAGVALVSIVLAMVPPSGVDSGEFSVRRAITVLVYGFGFGGVVFLLLLRWLPRSSLFARRGFVSHTSLSGVSTADSALEAQAAAQTIIGREGTVVRTLRPAGAVELDDGRELDVVAEGEFIEAGSRVRVVESSGGRVIVARLPS